MLTVTSVVTICHHTKECMILDLKEARMAAEGEVGEEKPLPAEFLLGSEDIAHHCHTHFLPRH